MELILGGRQTGRTTMLFERARRYHERKEPFFICGAHSHTLREAVREFGKEHVIAGGAADLYMRGRSRDTKLLVDDLDDFILRLFYRKPDVATLYQDEPYVLLPSYNPVTGYTKGQH